MEAQTTFMVRLASGQEFGPAPMEMIIEWAQQRRIPEDALLVPSDGAPPQSVLSDAKLRNIIQAPPTISTGVATEPSSAVNVIIPTRNPCALTAYYLAVFSVIMPLLAPVALVLGILGVRARLKRPEVHGLAHAWIGIIGGAAIMLLWIGIIALIVAAS